MASRVLKKGIHRVTQGYTTKHQAVDLTQVHPSGEPVIAHSAGVVVFCQVGKRNNKGSTGNESYGNCVKLQHENGYFTLYAHLASVDVKLGQTVQRGQEIGTMGNTGNSYGTHLHFEVRNGSQRLDPTPYLNADLPLANASVPTVTYRTRVTAFLPWVTGAHNNGSDGYAGVTNKPMTALQAKVSAGVLRYRVHLVGGTWLPWVTSTDTARWAGREGAAVDAVQAQLSGADGYEVQYRVSAVGVNRWYGWCTGLTDATGDGYAGVFGNPIDCLQMQIVKR